MGISNRLRRKSHASVRTLLRKQERSLARIDGSLRDIAERGIPERRPSRAQAFLHQILLGMLFAMGTVLGLALMSWLTYTYFRDSEVIRQIIEDQLRIRNFDFDRLREGAEGWYDFPDLFWKSANTETDEEMSTQTGETTE